MKKILTILLAGLFAAACSKQNAAPTEPVNEPIDTAKTALLFSGSFIDGPHGAVSGTANIYTDNGSYLLGLEDFETSNGPDLHVYLSEEVQPIHFIDLGKLKSTNGNQVYNIPAGTDFETYKYALIHCQQFNHLFGSTLLEEQ